jgi:hypothetical protein
MTESTGLRDTSSLFVTRGLNRFKTLGSSNVTRDRHMNLTNKRKPTERHCTVLRTPFVCRPCIPAPPCVLNGTVRCVCPSALYGFERQRVSSS